VNYNTPTQTKYSKKNIYFICCGQICNLKAYSTWQITSFKFNSGRANKVFSFSHWQQVTNNIGFLPPVIIYNSIIKFISCSLWSNSNYMCVMWLLCSKWQRTAVTESSQFMPSCPSCMNYIQVYDSYISVL